MSWPLLLFLQSVAAVPPRDLSELLGPIRDRGGIPALAGAIVTSRGLEAVGAVGRRSWTDSTPVTVDDQWHIGSCTKTVTATLVARLVDRGVLRWTTTVGEVMGSSVPNLDPTWRRVPIEWLLTHRSGLDRNFSDPLWERVVRDGGSLVEQRRRLTVETLASPPPNRPNTVTTYSNAGFIIAGAMLETLTGASWEDLVRREIFGPLAMTGSGFGAPGTPGRLDQPLGHTRGPDGWKPIPLGPGDDNPPVTGPTGTIHVTLADWARFLAAHLRGARGDRSFLSKAAWKRLHTRSERGWQYSPGWVVTESPWSGGVLLRHLGSNLFWVAEASMAPGRDVAILVVTNLGDDAAEKPFNEAVAAMVAAHGASAGHRR